MRQMFEQEGVRNEGREERKENKTPGCTFPNLRVCPRGTYVVLKIMNAAFTCKPLSGY